jgi:hypothetical protein
VTRFWPEGVAIVVTCDDLAAPKAFTWQGHRHVVAEILDRWRDDEGWWRPRVWRENFLIITNSGLLAEMYHDLLARQWFLQRVYD